MKLYPIIYTEGARAAAEALNKGVAALLVSSTELKKIVLFDIDRAKKAISKAGDFDNALIALGNRAIVGSVSFHEDNTGEDLYKIDTSAGVASFGPLAYQIAMYVIQPSWLMSDSSLKPASHRVWKNMYKLSEQGVYERKFLGGYSIDLINERYIGAERGKFMRYVESVEYGTIPGNEEYFLKWLRTVLPEEPIENFGQFWAYRKTSHDPKIKNLFDQSEKFIEQMRNIPTRELITRSAALFFNRLYDSAASY